MRGRDDLGMISQSEIIVGAKINDSLRSAVVSDGRARFSRGAHFRFVELHGPRACFHPTGKTGRRLEWVAAFAREEVSEAEIGGIIAHKKTAPNESGRGEIDPGRIV